LVAAFIDLTRSRLLPAIQNEQPGGVGKREIGVLYGGVLGLPIAFVIGLDDRIYSKHIGATDVSLLDREIPVQLQPQRPSPTN
jgi:hypothetical protein